jgi:hypothetical protein
MEKTASMIHEEHGLRIEPGGLLEKNTRWNFHVSIAVTRIFLRIFRILIIYNLYIYISIYTQMCVCVVPVLVIFNITGMR